MATRGLVVLLSFFAPLSIGASALADGDENGPGVSAASDASAGAHCAFSDRFTSPERCARLAEVQRVADVKARHRDSLFAIRGVIGVGVGSVDPGSDGAALLILIRPDIVVDDLPSEVEGIPVRVERRRPVQLLNGAPGCSVPCHGDQLPAPVPMGVTGGWEGDNGGCTLGFKACDLGTGETVFVTNSHCNDFPTCTLSLTSFFDWEHPGAIDDPAGTRIDIGDRTGHAGPSCQGNAANLTDATKIASTSEETAARYHDLGWQAAGFDVVMGDPVEKSGRSTGSTGGVVTAVGVDILVDQGNVFCCGALTMRDQIEWLADPGEETVPGDSGSALLVRVPNNAGSGDLFAVAGLNWGSDGTHSYANRIGHVLSALNLSLDFRSCFPECIFTEAAFAAAPPPNTGPGQQGGPPSSGTRAATNSAANAAVASAGADAGRDGPPPGRDVRSLVNLGHRFRDQILAGCSVGQELTQMYYQFSDEAVRIAARHPSLMARTSSLLLRYADELRELVETGQTAVKENDVRKVDRLLAAYQRKGGLAMAEALAAVREIVANPDAQAQLGVVVSRAAGDGEDGGEGETDSPGG